MIEINVKEVLQKKEQDKLNQKPRPKIELSESATHDPVVIDVVQKALQENVIKRTLGEVKSDIVKSLYVDFTAALNERNKLSTSIAHEVERDADQGALKNLYNRIESYRPSLQDLWHKIKKAERGEVPAQEKDPALTALLKSKWAELIVERDQLIDKRHKLKKKIAMKASQNPAKYAEWELELQKADARFNDIVQQIAEVNKQWNA
jgi:seryl-tRNA synthetase